MTEYNRPLLASNFYSSNGIDFSCPYKSIIGQSEIELSKKKEYYLWYLESTQRSTSK